MNHNYNNKAKSFYENIYKYVVMLSPNVAVMFIKFHLEPRVRFEFNSFMGQEWTYCPCEGISLVYCMLFYIRNPKLSQPRITTTLCHTKLVSARVGTKNIFWYLLCHPSGIDLLFIICTGSDVVNTQGSVCTHTDTQAHRSLYFYLCEGHAWSLNLNPILTLTLEQILNPLTDILRLSSLSTGNRLARPRLFVRAQKPRRGSETPDRWIAPPTGGVSEDTFSVQTDINMHVKQR